MKSSQKTLKRVLRNRSTLEPQIIECAVANYRGKRLQPE